MDFGNKQWDQADEDFNQWLNGNSSAGGSLLIDILKSIYLTFRQKEIERISPFCNKGFEDYLEKERIKLTEIAEPIFGDSELRFRISTPTEQERKARTYRENQRIINGILSGKHEIFNELYEYEFPKVVSMIIKNSGSVEMAQDVFQDAIVLLIEKVYAQKLDLTCSVKTYLYSICKILWLDQLRLHKKEKQLMKFFDQEYSVEDISINFYDTPDIFDAVADAINVLGDPCKQLLECFYYKNMNWEEISIKLGYANPASARNQKYKCLEKIRRPLANVTS